MRAVRSVLLPLVVAACAERSPYEADFEAGSGRCEGTLVAAALTVDGEVDDWSDIAPLRGDPQEDSDGPEGSDLAALYGAQHGNTLYLRLYLYEPANRSFGDGPSPHQGLYQFNNIGPLNRSFNVIHDGGWRAEGDVTAEVAVRDRTIEASFTVVNAAVSDLARLRASTLECSSGCITWDFISCAD